MDLIEKFKEKARSDPKRIVFPEGDDERILSACAKIAEAGIAYPIVLGNPDKIRKMGSKLNLRMEKVVIYDPSSSPSLEKYSLVYRRKRA